MVSQRLYSPTVHSALSRNVHIGRFIDGLPEITATHPTYTLLFRRHRLPLHALKRWVQTSPTRCARNPNIHTWLNRGRLIQVAGSNYPELWTVGGLGEQMRAAFRAKLTSDLIATVGDLRVLRKHPGKAESVCGDKQIHRPIRREVLAVATPANAGCQRFRYELKTHCAAKTTTGSFSHVFVSLLGELGLTGGGSNRLRAEKPAAFPPFVVHPPPHYRGREAESLEKVC